MTVEMSVHDFLTRVDVTDGCWEWGARIHRAGYGIIKVSGRSQYAHRVSYMVFNGSIPKGKEIDHVCRNRSCVNPTHLEAVTHLENMQRALPYRDRGNWPSSL